MITAKAEARWVGRAWGLGRLLFWAVAAVYAVELCRRSLTLGDEGYLLSQAAAILDGKVLYRDLDLFVAPGIWYLIAGLFSLTGPQVLVTRWAAAGCLLATMWVARRVVWEVGGPRWGDVAPVAVGVFAMWAFPAWSFAFYSPWATLFGLASLAAVLRWMRSGGNGWLFLCGVACGISLIFKQNYGAFAAIGCGAAVAIDLALRKTSTPGWSWLRWIGDVLKAGLPVATGVLVPVLPLIAILARDGALPAAYRSLVLRPFQGFVDAHTIPYLAFGDFGGFYQLRRTFGYIYRAVPMSVTDLSSRWPSSALWLIDALHWGLYWIPPVLFAGVLLRTWLVRGEATREDRALAGTAVFTAVYFVGVFPRADLNHLINVYQPVICLAAATSAATFGRGMLRTRPLRWMAAATVAAVFAGYALVAAAWMNDIRKLYVHPLTSPRGGVLVSQQEAESINGEVDALRQLTSDGEPVFAIPGLSMIPFLAERPMPTRFYNYYSVHVAFDRGLTAAQEIEKSGAKVVLSEYENFFSDPEGMLSYAPILTDYLRTDFLPLGVIGKGTHLLLRRREVPRRFMPGIALNFFCRSVAGGPPGSYAREHLLFASLHHSFAGMWGGRGEALSVCRVQVPDRARLHLLMELRQPWAVPDGSFAKASVWVWPDNADPVGVMSTEWSLRTESGAVRQAPREFEVPLDAWGGRVVTLILRSYVEATCETAVAETAGLEVVWSDGLLESDDFLLGPRRPSREDTTESLSAVSPPADGQQP